MTGQRASAVPGELTDLGARELAALLRAGSASPSEALDAYRRRLERMNPVLNAIVQVDLDRAARDARLLERRQERSRLPLYGVPMTVKGSFRVRGLAARVGNPDAPDKPADSDSEVVHRLRSAGAIIVGTTNVATDLSDFQTDNPIFGRTTNPWDPARTPGGSSGGSAAAVAARLSPIEVGSDTAGSVRIPAAFSGVFGFKPTGGAVPVRGHVASPVKNPRGGGVGVLATPGPLARSPADIRLVFDVIRGETSRPTGATGPLRLRVLRRFPDLRVAMSVAEAVDTLAASAKRRGLQVSSFHLPNDPREQHRLWKRLYSAASVHGSAWPVRYPGLLRDVAAAGAAWEAALPSGTVLVLPTVMCTAFPHRPSGKPVDIDGEPAPYWHLAGYTEPFNLLGMPALNIPAGVDAAGMPIGVQLVGRRGSDASLLDAAVVLEDFLPAMPAPAIPADA